MSTYASLYRSPESKALILKISIASTKDSFFLGGGGFIQELDHRIDPISAFRYEANVS